MEDILIDLSFFVWSMLAVLCAMTKAAEFLLQGVTYPTENEPSALGVSMGGIPRSSSTC